MPPGARQGDNVLHDSPHCHAPIHPPAPTPTPVPHPPIPFPIIQGATTVKVGGMPAARVGDQTQTCSIPPCVPGGPGVISKGSGTVMIANMPAARVGDMVAYAGCVAPIPSPTAKILPPGATTVNIGG
jgi:uncharacterized Zn-binding protein involved in type VI secretion